MHNVETEILVLNWLDLDAGWKLENILEYYIRQAAQIQLIIMFKHINSSGSFPAVCLGGFADVSLPF